ncbi:MAG: translocation/assembly module TamB domain-containing protein, partial [bacterium]
SNLVYNITVKGERGIWLRNSNADIELSIDLNIRKTLTESFYSGILKTRQGNFYYLDHNLKVTEGEISFDNINELNPDLNLNAEMYTRAMKIYSGKMERVKIILQLTGTLKEPEFNFYSEPAVLSQDDIISYLTLNVTPQEINAAEQREIFNKLVSERVLGYFEREVAKKVRDFIHLDYLMFETGLFEGGNGAKVTVGKYVAKNLYTTYTYNISELTQDIFKVEYYITKSHEMIGEKDEKGRYRLRYQFKFRF